MPGNSDPIYSRVGDVTTNGTTGMGQAVTAAANDYTGAGANNVLVFTADATNGGRVERIRARPAGTNVATVLRIFINNGSSSATPANNVLYAEMTLAATTLSEVAALAVSEIPNAATVPDGTGFPLVLPPGYKLLATLGTTVAAGYFVAAVGGAY